MNRTRLRLYAAELLACGLCVYPQSSHQVAHNRTAGMGSPSVATVQREEDSWTEKTRNTRCCCTGT